MSPQRIQWNRFAGQPLPPNTKLATRPTRFGNPFPVCEHRTREQAVEQFRLLLAGIVVGRDLCSHTRLTAERRLTVDDVRATLAGFNLACTCDLAGPCHADELLRVAAGERP